MDKRTPSGKVRTVYGDLPGCPTCGTIQFHGPLLCEHGVTPALADVEITSTIVIEDRDLYDKLLGRAHGPQPPPRP